MMDRLGDEIERELGRFGPTAGMADVVRVWPEVVGEVIARNAWPARIGRDGMLHVAVSSSTWGFELTQLEAEISRRLRERLGEVAPARLRFSPGTVPERPRGDAAKTRETPLAVSREQRAEAERLAAPIEDENLRKVVARAAAASLARAPSDRGF
jgi:hypothetical protein